MFNRKLKSLKLLAIGCLCILALCSSCKKEIYMQPTVTVNADIAMVGENLVIINNDTFTYNESSIELNRNYRLQDIDIKPGETKTIKLMEFAGSNVKELPEELKSINEVTFFCTFPKEQKGYNKTMLANYGFKYINFKEEK